MGSRGDGMTRVLHRGDRRGWRWRVSLTTYGLSAFIMVPVVHAMSTLGAYSPLRDCEGGLALGPVDIVICLRYVEGGSDAFLEGFAAVKRAVFLRGPVFQQSVWIKVPQRHDYSRYQ